MSQLILSALFVASPFGGSKPKSALLEASPHNVATPEVTHTDADNVKATYVAINDTSSRPQIIATL
jgi:hypothetical protein